MSVASDSLDEYHERLREDLSVHLPSTQLSTSRSAVGLFPRQRLAVMPSVASMPAVSDLGPPGGPGSEIAGFDATSPTSQILPTGPLSSLHMKFPTIPLRTLSVVFSHCGSNRVSSEEFLRSLISFSDEVKDLLERERVRVGSSSGSGEKESSDDTPNKDDADADDDDIIDSESPEVLARIGIVKKWMRQGRDLLLGLGDQTEMRMDSAMRAFRRAEELVFGWERKATTQEARREILELNTEVLAGIVLILRYIQDPALLSSLLNLEKAYTVLLGDSTSKSPILHSNLKCQRALCEVYNDIGLCYKKARDTRKAIKYYAKALHLERELGFMKGESKSLNNLGTINFSLRRFDAALDYLKKAYEIRVQTRDFVGQGVTLYNIASVYHHGLKLFDDALKFYEKCEVVFRKLKDMEKLMLTLKNRAKCAEGLIQQSIGRERTAIDSALLTPRSLERRANERRSLVQDRVRLLLSELRKIYELQVTTKHPTSALETLKQISKISNTQEQSEVLVLEEGVSVSETNATFGSFVEDYYDRGLHLQAFQVIEFIRSRQKKFQILYPNSVMILYYYVARETDADNKVLYMFFFDHTSRGSEERRIGKWPVPNLVRTWKKDLTDLSDILSDYDLLYQLLIGDDLMGDLVSRAKTAPDYDEATPSQSLLIVPDKDLFKVHFGLLVDPKTGRRLNAFFEPRLAISLEFYRSVVDRIRSEAAPSGGEDSICAYLSLKARTELMPRVLKKILVWTSKLYYFQMPNEIRAATRYFSFLGSAAQSCRVAVFAMPDFSSFFVRRERLFKAIDKISLVVIRVIDFRSFTGSFLSRVFMMFNASKIVVVVPPNERVPERVVEETLMLFLKKYLTDPELGRLANVNRCLRSAIEECGESWLQPRSRGSLHGCFRVFG